MKEEMRFMKSALKLAEALLVPVLQLSPQRKQRLLLSRSQMRVLR